MPHTMFTGGDASLQNPSLQNLHLRRTHEVPPLQTVAEPVAAVTHCV